MKKLLFFDVESSGVDPAKDRIVSLHAVKGDITATDGGWESYSFQCNPGVEMSAEVIAIHGITNEMIAEKPSFEVFANPLHKFMADCDLAGFNLLNFDIPILWEEFYRCGITWDLSGVRVIDCGNIFKLREPRTLAAALKFYCDKELEDAHNAKSDVEANVEVFLGQMRRYPDLKAMDMDALAKFCQFDERVDLAGKIVMKDGHAVYNIGKSKGVRVVDDPSFGYWMLNKDFSEQTKIVLRKLLGVSSEPESDLFR